MLFVDHQSAWKSSTQGAAVTSNLSQFLRSLGEQQVECYAARALRKGQRRDW